MVLEASTSDRSVSRSLTSLPGGKGVQSPAVSPVAIVSLASEHHFYKNRCAVLRADLAALTEECEAAKAGLARSTAELSRVHGDFEQSKLEVARHNDQIARLITELASGSVNLIGPNGLVATSRIEASSANPQNEGLLAALEEAIRVTIEGAQSLRKQLNAAEVELDRFRYMMRQAPLRVGKWVWKWGGRLQRALLRAVGRFEK